jgi:hypothetical protein
MIERLVVEYALQFKRGSDLTQQQAGYFALINGYQLVA